MTDEDRNRTWFARAVRRRLADHRIAADLRSRGWSTQAPQDEIERKMEATARRKSARSGAAGTA